MRFHLFQLSVLCGLQWSSLAFSHPTGPATLPLPSKIIYQFPLPTWIENISVRSNGFLLLNLLTSPDLYSINPLSSTPAPKLIYTFPNVTSLLGITEVFPDIFVILAGNFSLTTVLSTPYTYSAWSVDFTKSEPKISKIADLKEAYFPNGITKLPSIPGSVLIADSALGSVWRLNILTKKYSQIISKVPEMAPATTNAIGINGLRVYKGHLYWSNTSKASLYRARLSPTGTLVGKVETLATDPIAVDDFTIDEKTGVVWQCSNFGNTVFAVKDGRVETVIGSLSELTVAGDTAAEFGRRRADRDTLYVVTGGALASPVNGTLVEGGKVVAVDTRGYRI